MAMASSTEDETDRNALEMHFQLLQDLSENISPKTELAWNEFKNQMRIHFKPASLASYTDIFQICEKLLEMKLISYGKYNVLSKAFDAIHHQTCYNIVKEYTTKIKEAQTKDKVLDQTDSTKKLHPSNSQELSTITAEIIIDKVEPETPKEGIYDKLMETCVVGLEKAKELPPKEIAGVITDLANAASRFVNVCEALEAKGIKVSEVTRKCLKLLFIVESKEALSNLWHMYRSGELLDILQEGIVSEYQLTICNVNCIQLHVQIAEEDFQECLTKTGSSTAKQVTEITSVKEKRLAEDRDSLESGVHPTVQPILQPRRERENFKTSVQRAQTPIKPKHKLRCPSHPLKDTEMTCETCSGQLVCSKCVISPEHRGHTFCDVQEILERKMSNLAQNVSTINTKLSENEKDIKTCEREESRNDQLAGADVDKINERRQYLKEKIDEAASNFIKLRKELTQNRREIVQKNTESYQRYSLQLQLCSQRCTQALKSGKYEDIQDAETEANNLLYNITLPSTQVPGELFTSNEVTDQQMKQLFGLLSDNKLRKPPIHKPQPGANGATGGHAISDVIDILSSFQHAKMKNIKSLCITDDDEAWVAIREGAIVLNYIQLVTRTGEIKQTVTFPDEVTDVCKDKGRTVFVCCFDGAVYQMIGQQGKRIHRFTAEYKPNSMCITSTGEFIICHYEQSKVSVYDGQGSVIKSLGEQGRYSSIIVYPFRVRYNYNTGDVAILDDSLFTVIVLDSKLRFRFLYNGKATYTNEKSLPSEIKNERFQPWDVTFDADNNIIISNVTGMSVFTLNGEGQYIRTLFGDSVEPRALTIDSQDSLWVGYGDGKIELIRY